MRQLVIDKIKRLFFSRCTDLCIPHLNYNRRKENRPDLECVIVVKCDDFEYLMPQDLDKFLEQLTDAELLEALDSQLCDKYR